MAIAPAAVDLRRMIARAAPPSERGDGSWVEPDPAADAQATSRNVAAWKAAVAEDAEGAAWLQDVLDLPDETLTAMFSPVRVREGAELPGWAAVILRALEEIDDTLLNPAEGVLAPFMAIAAVDLDRIITETGLAVGGSAHDDLLRMLRTRLWRVISPALEYEQHLLSRWVQATPGQTPQLDGSVDGWTHRLGMFPVLAHIIGTAYAHWRAFLRELCERIELDAGLIARELLGRDERGALVGVSGDTGDLHNDGRAVALLTFEGDARAVYKPKDLTAASAYMDLVRFLNAAGLELPLPVRTIVPRGAYTWEGFVSARPCSNAAQVSRFYVRMGETIRLLQLLEARDFWLDNLIADGEYPHFIDLEMLVQPRIALPQNLSAAELQAYAALEEAASRTSAIAMPMTIAPGVPSEELGALAPAGPFASPFRHELKALSADGVTPPLTEEGYVLWEHPEHVPVLDGMAIVSDACFDDVLAGYRAMQACLLSVQEPLLTADGPLAALADAPVRFIYRDTWSCIKLVQHSVQPRFLGDAIHRDLVLAQLFRPITAPEHRGVEEARTVASEIRDLRGLDVPFFLSRPSSRAVVNAHDGLLGELFPQPAWDRLRARVTALDAFPLERHLDLVRSSFASGRDLGAPHAARARDEGGVAETTTDWLAGAVAIGEHILSEAFAAGDGGEPAWIGLTYHPPFDLSGLEVLRPDMLTGTTGIAVLFADLFRATGDLRWRAAAQAALEPSRRAWREWADRVSVVETPYARNGAFYGAGAWLYAAGRIATALDDRDLAAEAGRLVARALPLVQQGPVTGDPVSGQLGLLLACLAVAPGRIDSASANDVASRLVEQLASFPAPSSVLERGGRARHGFASLPDARAGTALALSRLVPLLPDEPRIAARRALARWTVSRLGDEPAGAFTAGTLATLVEITPSAGVEADIPGIFQRWAEPCLESEETCRLLDVIEISLLLAGMDDPHAHSIGRDASHRAAQRLVTIRSATDSWFPTAYAADRHNLSAVWGITAVAHGLIRTAQPGAIPSLRLLGSWM